jgi:hypothetical protein
VTLEECMEMLTDAKIVSSKSTDYQGGGRIILQDFTLQQIWHDSLQTMVDTMKDQAALKEMNYTEFLVMVARLAHEIYKQEKGELHEKIEKLLNILCSTVDGEKINISRVKVDEEGWENKEENYHF